MEKTERTIGTLIAQISSGEIKLPEIQRGYVWKPTQVAKLIDSLYQSYPTGSLLFWKAVEAPETRRVAISTPTSDPAVPPLYLLDGQQRLTSLHRVLNDDPNGQIVFNVDSEAFQNQSAATVKDARWIKVYDLFREDVDPFEVRRQLIAAGAQTDPPEIGRRLIRLAGITSRMFYMEILDGFGYEEIAQIFVRVSSGRSLKTSDLALALLSARWHGIVAKLETEADHWAARHYRDLPPPGRHFPHPSSDRNGPWAWPVNLVARPPGGRDRRRA